MNRITVKIKEISLAYPPSSDVSILYNHDTSHNQEMDPGVIPVTK